MLAEVARRGVALRRRPRHPPSLRPRRRQRGPARPSFPTCASTARPTTRPRIPGITDRVSDGDAVQVGGLRGRVIFIPAHTSGHVAYWFPDGARRVHRRHALRRRLRPAVRGRRRADDGVARQARRPARRHAGLLRARVHREEPAVRADARAGQRSAARQARRRAGPAPRRASPPCRARSPTRRRPTRSSAPTARSWRRRCARGSPACRPGDPVALFAAVRG